MQLTRQTMLSIELLMLCAASVSSTQIMTLGEAAAKLGTSKDYLSQLMKILAQHGFVVGQRGRYGGIHLSRPASQIQLLEVLLKLELKLRTSHESYGAEGIVLQSVMQAAMLAFYNTLHGVTLKQLSTQASRVRAGGHVSLEAVLARYSPTASSGTLTVTKNDPHPTSSTVSHSYPAV